MTVRGIISPSPASCRQVGFQVPNPPSKKPRELKCLSLVVFGWYCEDVLECPKVSSCFVVFVMTTDSLVGLLGGFGCGGSICVAWSRLGLAEAWRSSRNSKASTTQRTNKRLNLLLSEVEMHACTCPAILASCPPSCTPTSVPETCSIPNVSNQGEWPGKTQRPAAPRRLRSAPTEAAANMQALVRFSRSTFRTLSPW